MAGTANDYIGTLSVTRSGRTCRKWLSDGLKKMQEQNTSQSEIKFSSRLPKRMTRVVQSRWKSSSTERDILFESFSNLPSPSRSIRKLIGSNIVDPAYLNSSLYPERSVQNASNYCRNPSRNIAGTWCYTTDPQVPQDLCDVRDCERPGENTIVCVRAQIDHLSF